MGHLASESFNTRIGVKTVIVSYRGTAPALTDVIGGQTTLMVAPLGSALQQIQAGSLRAFAVMSERRSPQLPERADRRRGRLPGPELPCSGTRCGARRAWHPTSSTRLNAAVQAASKHPDLVQKLDGARRRAGHRDGRRSSRAFFTAEATRSAELARVAGIQPPAN